MGLLDKVKNLFTEEVDEPEEKVVVKKETKKPQKEEIKKEIFKQERTVEIAPARKETADFFERELVEEKKKVEVKEKNSSILFADDAFSDLPRRRQEEKPKSLARDIYGELKEERYKPKKIETVKVEEKKSFKPSPIISPVYGILDKNYKKDDIPSKVTPNPYKSDKVTVDDVRNKAFGTLEDELENTLVSKALVVNNEEAGIDIFEELEPKSSSESISEELAKQKQQIEEINEIIKTNVSPENKKITSRKIDNILEELDEIEELIPNKDNNEKSLHTKEEDAFIEDEVVEENNDDLEEGDLFNLIDSMYEKRDD